MGWKRRDWMGLAAVNGFLAVAVGAFAAHGIHDPRAQELLKTGAQYQFMHTMATFACATIMNIGGTRAKLAPLAFLPGILLFSGSLYALAFGAPSWVGAITPVGGVLFLVGWSVLIRSTLEIDRVSGPASAEKL
jgi:uncharacterized membrane protein YgdD (TMEM256/DUF423 family)